MGMQHGKLKKKRKEKRKTKEVTNRISTLLYSTCERAPAISYRANSC